MSAFKKTDVKDPSLFGIAFFAIPMALVGALSGFTLLASIPPEPFGSVAEYESDLERNPRQNILYAHYFKGSRSTSNDWAEKRKILLKASDTSVELTDSEINAWIADEFQKPQALFSEEAPKAYVLTGLPNVFINADEGIHFNVPLKFFVFGKEINCLLIGQGYFSGEDPVEFRLSKLRLNEALIPFPKKQQYERLLHPLFKSFYESDEFIAIKEAWKKVDTVELTEAGIRLNLD